MNKLFFDDSITLGIYYTVDPATASQFVYGGPSTATASQATWLTRIYLSFLFYFRLLIKF